MRNTASAVVLAMGLGITGTAQAQYYDWEYNLDPLKYSSISNNPIQPNLAQIGVTRELHDDVLSSILNPQDPSVDPSVTIAILDGMVDVTHIDLATFGTDDQWAVGDTKSDIIFVPEYGGRFRKYSSHATHVAGTAAANRNSAALVGVDPFARIISIPVFDDRSWIANDLGEKALNAALANGARVVNMSYGSTTKGAIFLSGELDLLNNYSSMVLVRAGGNDGVYAKAQPFSGNAATDLRNLLLVGSVDANNQISSFSNKPGTACIGSSCDSNNLNAIANFWMVAPGEGIWSDLPGDKVGTMSGTSMAAPHVTGAAALVFQYALAGGAADITAGDVAEILKYTATDLNANGGATDGDSTYSHLQLGNVGAGIGDGVDAVYGWGLLDVARAISPLGDLTIPIDTLTITKVTSSGGDGGGGGRRGGRPFSLGLSSIAQNSAGLESALSGLVVLDGYNRAFTVDSPKLAAPRPSITTENPLQRMFGLISATRTDLGSDGDYRVSLISGSGQGGNGFSAVSYESARVHFDVGRGASFGYFTSANAAEQNGQESFSRTMGDNFFTGSNVVSAPFGRSLFFGGDYRAAPDLTFSALYVQSTPYDERLSQIPDNVASIALKGQPISSLAKFGARHDFAYGISIGGSYGLLAERGRALGMRTSGAFSLGDTTLTHMGDVNLNAQLGEASALSVFAEQTSTTVGGASGSLFGSAQTWRGSKYGIAFSQADIFGSSDFFKLRVTRSLQIDNGALALHLPVGRELDGTVNYENRYVPIGSNDNPLEVGFVYLRGSGGLTYGTEVILMQDRLSSGRLSDFSAVGALHWSF